MFDWIQSRGSVPASVESPRNGFLLGVQSLIGNRVYDADEKLVGKIEEIVIDTRTGCIRHAVLAVGGVMGLGCIRLAVPWSALTADVEFKRCIVDLTQMQLTAVRVPGSDPWLQRISPAAASVQDSRPSRLFGS